MRISFAYLAIVSTTTLALVTQDPVQALEKSAKLYKRIPEGVAIYLSDPKKGQTSAGLGLPGVISFAARDIDSAENQLKFTEVVDSTLCERLSGHLPPLSELVIAASNALLEPKFICDKWITSRRDFYKRAVVSNQNGWSSLNSQYHGRCNGNIDSVQRWDEAYGPMKEKLDQLSQAYLNSSFCLNA